MNSPALNPCKKCGSDAVIHEQMLLPHENETKLIESEFIAACECCTQKGEWKRSEAEAAASWNDLNKVRS